MGFQECGQCVIEFLWHEINGRDLIPPHDFVEIPPVELEQFGGFPLGNDALTQQLHHECLPYAGRDFPFSAAKSCHHFFREHNVEMFICHCLSFWKSMYAHEVMVP